MPVYDRFVPWLERAMLSRRPGVLQSAALRLVGALRPGVLETHRGDAARFHAGRRVSVVSPADRDVDQFRKLQWGDTWVKYELVKALGELGFIVTDVDPDAVVHLYGGPSALPHAPHRVIWVYSHPDRLHPRDLDTYDRVLCLSSTMVTRIRAWGHHADTLPWATSRRPRTSAHRHDVVFVGNARGGSRPVVDLVGEPSYDFKVWGRGFERLPARYWAGGYFDYGALGDLYSSSLIALNDHASAMAENGFIAPRVYDIIGSGGFCISDQNPALTALFGDAVPQYRNRDELHDLIAHYLGHPEARLPLMERAQSIVLASTWADRAARLMDGIA